MNYLKLIREALELRRAQKLSRKKFLKYQSKKFHNFLEYVWNNSEFYREYYTQHGIKQADLPNITLSDLPFTSKELIMENFDRVITDPRVTREKIDQHIYNENKTGNLLLGKYAPIHTSGTSGTRGVFLYNKNAWITLLANSLVRLSKSKVYLKKKRVAFFAATHGRFAGVTFAKGMNSKYHPIKLFSNLDHIDLTIDKLNKYQPHFLTGYCSSTVELARRQIAGKLDIKPDRIIVSGDKLSDNMRHVMKEAWPMTDIVEMYGASEAICMGGRSSFFHDEMDIYEDIAMMEILDGNNEEVNHGEQGRVVITNLINPILPIIRYNMKDNVLKGTYGLENPNYPFKTISQVIGRESVGLPILNDSGSEETLHHSLLETIFVEGLDKIQFVLKSSTNLEVNYQASNEIENSLIEEVEKLLRNKNASNSVKYNFNKMNYIPNDPKTGKFNTVVNEAS